MLSGGQRARVSLARALLKSPSLLILTKPAAHSTPRRSGASKRISFSGKERATIAVAHRLSTIRNANEILSMVDGAIVERGLHDDLPPGRRLRQSMDHSNWRYGRFVITPLAVVA